MLHGFKGRWFDRTVNNGSQQENNVEIFFYITTVPSDGGDVGRFGECDKNRAGFVLLSQNLFTVEVIQWNYLIQ